MKEKTFNIYKKIYPNAKLKNLGRKRQQVIVDYLNGSEEKEGSHTLKETAAWLRTEGIETSASSVSAFRTWFLRRARMEANQAAALDRIREDRKKGMFKTLAEEKEAGQIYFNHCAVEQEDVNMWVLMQRLDLARRQQDLDARKIKLLEERQAKTKEAVQEVKMTPEEKEERIRQIMGLE